MRNDAIDLPRPLPRLSDEAAVQILDFLHHFTYAFETAYGDQIQRYYQDLESFRNPTPHPAPTDALEDPPF